LNSGLLETDGWTEGHMDTDQEHMSMNTISAYFICKFLPRRIDLSVI